MRGAPLFTGCGGLDLGLHLAGHEVVLQCESDPHARQVLRRRFPGTRLETDVAALAALPVETELLAAGFPCVDVSRAGLRAGLGGSGTGLVRHVFRLLRESARHGRPVPWVLLENVPGLLERGGEGAEAPVERVVSGLEALGYAWAQRVICTAAFGFPNRRRRVFILASLHGDPRDPLLSLGRSPQCPGDCAEVLGAPCVRCRAEDLRNRDPALKETMVALDLGNAQAAGGVDMIPCLKTGNGTQILLLQGAHRVGLLPVGEAERLQGFPRGYTLPCYPLVPPGLNAHRDPPPLLKDAKARDSLRWQLLGNAVSVPVAQWLGEQLARPYISKYMMAEDDKPMGWVRQDEALAWEEHSMEPGAEREGLWQRLPAAAGVRGQGRGAEARRDRANDRRIGSHSNGISDEDKAWPRACWFLPGQGRFRCMASEYPVVRPFEPLGRFLKQQPLRLPPGYELQRLQTYLRRLQHDGWDVSETIRVLFACGRDLHDATITRDLGRAATVGEVVWARVPGFPWWPAEVVEPHEIPEHLFEGLRSREPAAELHCDMEGLTSLEQEKDMSGGAVTAAARSMLVPRTPKRPSVGVKAASLAGESTREAYAPPSGKSAPLALPAPEDVEEGAEEQLCWGREGLPAGGEDHMQDDVEASARLVPYGRELPRAPREGLARRPEKTRFVVFFGQKKDSAWVPEGDVLPFEEHKHEVLNTARIYGHDKKHFKEALTEAELALKVRRRQKNDSALTVEEEAEFLGETGARHRAAVQQAARVASAKGREPCRNCKACLESKAKGQNRKCLVHKVMAAYLAGRAGADVARLGEKAKGARLSVYWPLDYCYYDCTVVGFDRLRMKHVLFYDDEEYETIALWGATQEIKVLNEPADWPQVFTEWEAAREAESREEEDKKARAKAKQVEKEEKEKAWRKAQLEPVPLEQLTPAERSRREQMEENERRRRGIFSAPAVRARAPDIEPKEPVKGPEDEPKEKPAKKPEAEPKREPGAKAMSGPKPKKQAVVPVEPAPAAEMPPASQVASPPVPGSGAVFADKLRMQEPHDVPVPAPKRFRLESGIPFFGNLGAAVTALAPNAPSLLIPGFPRQDWGSAQPEAAPDDE